MRKSINKTTVIIVLAVFLTLSIGYALFSDTITIEGTATAQGNFDIEATCQTGLLVGISKDDFPKVEQGYSNDTCYVTNDKVTYSVDLNYPGATRYFTLKLTNIGDIDAKIDTENLVTKNNDSICVDGHNGEANGEIEDNECSNEYSNVIFSGFSELGAVEKDGNIYIPSDELFANLAAEFVLIENDKAYYVLKPGNSIYIIFESSACVM